MNRFEMQDLTVNQIVGLSSQNDYEECRTTAVTRKTKTQLTLANGMKFSLTTGNRLDDNARFDRRIIIPLAQAQHSNEVKAANHARQKLLNEFQSIELKWLSADKISRMIAIAREDA